MRVWPKPRLIKRGMIFACSTFSDWIGKHSFWRRIPMKQARSLLLIVTPSELSDLNVSYQCSQLLWTVLWNGCACHRHLDELAAFSIDASTKVPSLRYFLSFRVVRRRHRVGLVIQYAMLIFLIRTSDIRLHQSRKNCGKGLFNDIIMSFVLTRASWLTFDLTLKLMWNDQDAKQWSK